MNCEKFDIDNLFDYPFQVDKHLLGRMTQLKILLEAKYRASLTTIIVQGARTDESNKEYYQKKYGESWEKFYNARSLHIVRKDTGNMLRAVDIAFETEKGERITGQEIYRTIKDNFLFSTVGIADNYVHVDVLIRAFHYR